MKKNGLVFSVYLLCLGLSQVAHAEEFLLDTKDVDMSRYYEDLQECKAFAEKQSVSSEAIGSAVTYGAVGALIGSVAAGSSEWGEYGAKWGAIEGMAEGAASGYEKKRGVTRNCLVGRGYKVLN